MVRKSAKLPPSSSSAPPPPLSAATWSWTWTWRSTSTSATAISVSVTKREIEKFWRKKRSVEEDHFLAAIKAAARLRLRSATLLSEEDYQLFMMESLLLLEEENNTTIVIKDDNLLTPTPTPNPNFHQDIPVGIKDWWTKSKYAYLNQPPIGSTGKPRRRLNYIPNRIHFHQLS